MIAQLIIDWNSLFEEWFVRRTDSALDAVALESLRLRLSGIRRGLVRNGMLFVDQEKRSLQGLSRMMTGLLNAKSLLGTGHDVPQLVAAWTRLQDELKLFQRLYESVENRILVQPAIDVTGSVFSGTLGAANFYLKSTRLNRRVYDYPATAVSEEEGLETSPSGFVCVRLENYEESDTECERQRWACGVSIEDGSRREADCAFAALSIASGAQGEVCLYDPHWSPAVLTKTPNRAWVESTRYMLEFFVANPHVSEVVFCSADELRLDRKMSFGPLVEIVKSACAARNRREKLSVRVKLRDDTFRRDGRKAFHNRYIACGRFVIEVPNGLDVVSELGYLRSFEFTWAPADSASFLNVKRAPDEAVLTGRNMRNLIADHQTHVVPSGVDEVVHFVFENGHLLAPGDEF